MSGLLRAPLLARSWLKAGLAFVLTDSEERVKTLKGPGKAARPAREASPGGVRQEREVPPVDRRPPSPARTSRAASPAVRQPVTASRPSARIVAAHPASKTPDGGIILPPQNWPAPWVALRERRPLPPRPMVVWTYPGLGDDLTGTPVPVRQQVIVRLLASLRHPAGTHVFWPFALPGEETENGSLFWSGEALLRPRVLLLFGGESVRSVGLDPSLALYAQHRVAGRRVIVMPPVLELAGDEGLFGRAYPFLARLLSFCGSS